jgi:hypothetical protein
MGSDYITNPERNSPRKANFVKFRRDYIRDAQVFLIKDRIGPFRNDRFSKIFTNKIPFLEKCQILSSKVHYHILTNLTLDLQ